MIVYDGDAGQVYTTTSFDKACASIESSIRGYLGGEDDSSEEMYHAITRHIRSLADKPCIPITFGKLVITVYRWEIDSSNLIHQTLSKCHNTVDHGLQQKITDLFSESIL